MSDQVFGSSLRKKIFLSIIFIVFMSFVFKLSKMQILEHKDYEVRSSNNSVKKIPIKAPRGIFFDRNFSVLVSNKPSYTLEIIPAIYDKTKDVIIEKILGEKENFVKNILYKKRGYSKYLSRVIKRNVSFKNVVWFEEHKEELPGVKISVEMQRDYSFGINGSHVFGYLREINAQQLKEKKNYSMGDYIGIQGAERAYEEHLRGEKGYHYILVDSKRKTIGKYLEGKDDKQPIKGDDLLFTIDYNTQKIAEELLKNLKGSVVAIEPETGEILAFVSAPQFNLQEFASFTSKKYIRELSVDPANPLFNRASKSIYPPGSTYKMLAALLGLKENIITDKYAVICKGGYQYGNRFFRCTHHHGYTDLGKAIEQSCNTFFYKLILDIGLEKWAAFSKDFGFGQKTGFDLGNESVGIVPDKDYYDRVYGRKKWGKGTLLSLGIGQGELSVTTLQLAQYTAMLANFGKTKVPHIVKAFLVGNTNLYTPIKFEDRENKLPKEDYNKIRAAMLRVVESPDGTAHNIKLPNIKIAGKTGTSQNPHGKDHAVFIAFAPYEKPKIAVAVFIENAGFGSTYAAPIAQKIIKTYLENLEKNEPDS
jgi:penicillin-binding protein 2